MKLLLPACALLAVAIGVWGVRHSPSRAAQAAAPRSAEGTTLRAAEGPAHAAVAPASGSRSVESTAADLKRRLFDETDLRRKWAIVCRLATMPETEKLFADPADRRRLDAIIEEVRLAIKRGELKEVEEEP